MEMLRDDSTAISRIAHGPKVQSAQLICLEKLQPGDIVNFSGGADGLMSRVGDAEVERLLTVGLIPRGDITANDQREVMQAEVSLEPIHFHACCGEGIALGLSDGFGQPARADAAYYFDGIKLPQNVGLREKLVGCPVPSAIAQEVWAAII
jgi:hypothetical protein